MAEYPGGGVRICPLDGDGRRCGPVEHHAGPQAAVRARPEAERWVWRSTAALHPRLLDAGLWVARCYDAEAAEAILLGHEGAGGAPRSLPAALARLRRLPVPDDPPPRAVEPEKQASLFDPEPGVPLPPGADPLEALLEVYAGQVARTAAARHPQRMRLLLAAESAGTLVAVEMGRAGLPWRADLHRRLLDELLGERYAGGREDLEPRRLAELAEEVSRAFGAPVRPDLPAEVTAAFRRAGIAVTSTRSWELRRVEHPAVARLLEYK